MIYTPQHDESDCGPACLAMLASHFGMKKSITSIRTLAGTDKQGTNLAGMVKVAQKMGFTVKALKGTAEALSPDMPLPFIAHVAKPTEKGMLLHFVLVVKLTKKYMEIWDPDPTVKKCRMTQDEFCNIWSGYVLFLNPGPEFMPEKGNGTILFRFLPLLRPHAGTLSLACRGSA